MGKLLASLTIIVIAATVSFFTFTLVSNASLFTTTYSHVWRTAAGTPYANNQPSASTATGYTSTLLFPGDPDPGPPDAGGPVANFVAAYPATVPGSWSLAAGSSIPVANATGNGGVSIGGITSIVSLGLFNGGCASTLTVPIDFFNSSTNTADEVTWDSDGSNIAFDVEPVQFPGDTPNGVPAEAEHYPEYLNRIFDVDGPNGQVPPLTPFSRLYGQVTVNAGAPPTHLNFVVFSPDQFQNVAAGLPAGMVNPQDDISDSFGFLSYVVLNNPVQPTTPTSVTDFCSRLTSIATIRATTGGELHLVGDNLCANTVNDDFNGGLDTKVNDGCPVQGIPEEVTGIGPDCDDAVDDDLDGWPNDGCNKAGSGLSSPGENATECLNNFTDGADNDADTVVDEGCVKLGYTAGPMADRGDSCDSVDNDGDGTTDEGCGIANISTSAAGKGILGTDTHLVRVFSLAARDLPDSDDIENSFDPCPLTDGGTWDPRSFGPTNDTDGDGLTDDCDPVVGTPSAAAGATCAGAAGFGDEDQDCFPNRGDNCPLVWNGNNPNTDRTEGQDDLDVPFGRLLPDGGNRWDDIGAACEPAVAASGAAEVDGTCANATSDDGTDESPARTNDGCPQVGATSESNGTFDGGPNCANSTNEDGGDDSVVNDGCPQQGVRAEGDQCRGDPADGAGTGLDDDGDTVPDDGCGYDNDYDGAVNEDAKNGSDDDLDGLTDEDPADDFDGDGSTADEAATLGGVTNRSEVEAQGAGNGSSAANARAAHSHKSVAYSAVCLATSADADTDGWCDATETALGSNTASAASTPESLVVDAAGTDLTPMPGTCNDGVDNDGVGGTDGADAGCTAAGGDTDGDGVLDATDNCDNQKNPDQLDTHADTPVESTAGKGGDECDIDDDDDKLMDIREYALGLHPKKANTDGVGGNDRADTLAAGPVDTDGDTFVDGVERIIGTDPFLKCTKSLAPNSFPTDRNLRRDAHPLDITRDDSLSVSDVLKFKGRTPNAIDETYPTETNPAFGENRLDLDGSGSLSVSDVLKFKGKTPAVCTP